jgi:hypothetical protein
MENIQKAIDDIEVQMAANKAVIDQVNADSAPLRAELEVANAKVRAAQNDAEAIARSIEELRGDPVEWLNFKKRHGQLASTRMQLLELLKAQA